MEAFAERAVDYTTESRMVDVALAIDLAEIRARDKGAVVLAKEDVLVSHPGEGEVGPYPARILITDREAVWMSVASGEVMTQEHRGLYILVADDEPRDLAACMVTWVDRDEYDRIEALEDAADPYEEQDDPYEDAMLELVGDFPWGDHPGIDVEAATEIVMAQLAQRGLEPRDDLASEEVAEAETWDATLFVPPSVVSLLRQFGRRDGLLG